MRGVKYIGLSKKISMGAKESKQQKNSKRALLISANRVSLYVQSWLELATK